jgi:hypothetical protein
MHLRAANDLAVAQEVASEAVIAFSMARPHVKGLQTRLVGLIGLMSLMARMVVGGNVPAGEEGEEPYAYPKAMAHLLPRTDFAAMFGRLPDPLQEALKAPDVIDTGRPAFVSLMAELCAQGLAGGIDKPVLGWSKWRQIDPGMIVPDLTREEWAKGIVANQDRLSQTGYLAWLESRRDTLQPEVYSSASRRASSWTRSARGRTRWTRAGPPSCRWSSSARSCATTSSAR